MMQRIIRDFLRHSFQKKSNKRRELVLRMWNIHEWDYEIEAAWRCARLLPE